MITHEQILDNVEFIAKIERQIGEELSKIVCSLMLKKEVLSLIGAIRLEILNNKGVLRFQGELVSLDNFIIDSDLNLNIYSDEIFVGLVGVLNRYKKELINRGFNEYRALKMWTDGNTGCLNLRLTSFKEVRSSIIKEIKKDGRITQYIASYEQIFSS